MVNRVTPGGAGLGALWSVTQSSWGPMVGGWGPPPKFLSRVGAPCRLLSGRLTPAMYTESPRSPPCCVYELHPTPPQSEPQFLIC